MNGRTQQTVLSLLAGALIIFSGCAKVASPTGGDKDSIPPVIRRSMPENNTSFFRSDKIEIQFDEYIRLREINKKLIISPPMKETPEIRLKGKSLIITLGEPLHENATYTFNFSDAIVDNNEGNPLDNFEYVFSTGARIDSLRITGKLLDALEGTPVENAFVMMYDNLADSTPIRERPLYLGKTNKEGLFSINHLKSDSFKVFALKDLNANYRFDLPNEEIAFLSGPLWVTAPVMPDSLAADSIQVQPVSAVLSLHMFREMEEKKQYLRTSARPRKELVTLSFNSPLRDPWRVTPVTGNYSADWFILERNKTCDSLNLWLTDTSLVNSQYLKLALAYPGIDSAGMPAEVLDTVELRFVQQERSRRGRAETEKEKESRLSLRPGVSNNGLIELNQSFRIHTATPVTAIDTSGIRLFELVDSVWQERSFVFTGDSFRLGSFALKHAWKENTEFRLFVGPGCFTDFLNLTNDTLEVRFKSRKTDYYGNIVLKLSNIGQPVLVQFMTEKNEILRQDLVSSDRVLSYDYLPPRKYRFRAVHDINRNMRWDPGKYLEGRQPEQVEYLGEVVDVRSNWEKELEWSVSF